MYGVDIVAKMVIPEVYVPIYCVENVVNKVIRTYHHVVGRRVHLYVYFHAIRLILITSYVRHVVK